MDIKYVSHSSFIIKTRTATVVTDPYDAKQLGLKYPKTEADIVTISHHHPDHNFTGQIAGSPLVIDWPGDYEKMGVRITGFKSYHDKKKGTERGENILFKFETEELSILHCGDLGLVPDDAFIQELGDINILMVPVGGHYTINADEAVDFIKKLEPNIVIPMHYKTASHTAQVFAPLTGLDEFIKKMGVTVDQALSKFTIKKENIIEEEMKVVALQPEA